MECKSIIYKSTEIEPFEGVIRVYAKQNDLYEESDLEEILKACIEVNQNEPVRILMDMSDYSIILSNSAKAYFHNSQLAKKMVIGEAVVTKSVLGSVMYDILIRAANPPIAMRFFKVRNKALQWLKELPPKSAES
jgi:hypothetical protein